MGSDDVGRRPFTFPDSREAALGYRALEALQVPGTWGIEDSQVAFIRALTDSVLDEAGVSTDSDPDEARGRKIEDREVRDG